MISKGIVYQVCNRKYVIRFFFLVIQKIKIKKNERLRKNKK